MTIEQTVEIPASHRLTLEIPDGGDKWVVGYDTKAIETLRTDLTQSIGN